MAQCQCFVNHLVYITAMYFVFMFGGCSMFISLHLDAYLLLIADRCHILKRLPFPNRSSDSYDLYIVFKRFHPLYPVAHLVFQVDARFMHFPVISCILHPASHPAQHIVISSYCLVLPVVDCILVACLSCWVEPGDEFATEEPVEFACEDPVNSDNCAGKMIIPSKSLLSLLCQFARSFAMPMLRCLPLAFKPPKLPCQTSNPPCPSKPLIGYVTALLSPSYSVVSCR